MVLGEIGRACRGLPTTRLPACTARDDSANQSGIWRAGFSFSGMEGKTAPLAPAGSRILAIEGLAAFFSSCGLAIDPLVYGSSASSSHRRLVASCWRAAIPLEAKKRIDFSLRTHCSRKARSLRRSVRRFLKRYEKISVYVAIRTNAWGGPATSSSCLHQRFQMRPHGPLERHHIVAALEHGDDGQPAVSDCAHNLLGDP